MKNSRKYTWKGIDLETLRQDMDPPADEAVKAIYESESMDYLRKTLEKMAKNDSFVPKDFPEPISKLVHAEQQIDITEKDIKHFQHAHEIWKRDGMKFIFILFFRALPYTYMAEKPAHVLNTTKLLITHAQRRIFETAQFVFDVMDEDWWMPNKSGILTALKVRIMHAAMRHVILARSNTENKWNKKWGNPISQEDLVATNQVFSLEFFKGMRMLGMELSADEQESWFHTWKTIGKIMGVDKKLISKDVKEAWTLQHEIYAHLFKDETHAGIPLAKALVETLDHFHLPLKLCLMIMKRMLADEQFPECFERMLGPSYEAEYPELFHIPETEEATKEHEAMLRDHYHTNLRAYYHTLKDKRPDYQHDKPAHNWFKKILLWILVIIGGNFKKTHAIDIHLDKLHNILHHDDGEPVEELEEDLIIESMSIFGGIMVGILSFHFRKGKNSGFRIPDTLQDNWSLKG